VGKAAMAYYDLLMDKGVRIFLYDDGVIHAKTMSVDGNLCFFGSSNFDIRSFTLNFEINCVIYGENSVAPLLVEQKKYLEASAELSRSEWAERPFIFKSVEGVAKLMSPLL